MKRIKRNITCLSLLMLSQQIMAQEKAYHEFGIQLSSLQAFSAIYKKEVDVNKYVRVQVGSGNFSELHRKDSDPQKQLQLNFSGGVERRKALTDKTNFVHGLAPTFSVLSRTDDNSKQSLIRAGIAYILGVQYNFSDHFYISLESMPSVSGILSKTTNSDSQIGYNIGFHNNIANITLAHRFSRTTKKAQ